MVAPHLAHLFSPTQNMYLHSEIVSKTNLCMERFLFWISSNGIQHNLYLLEILVGRVGSYTI